jgi:3-dehydroquinate dehydratase I
MICVSIGDVSPELFNSILNRSEFVELRIDLLSKEYLAVIDKYFSAPSKMVITSKLNQKYKINRLVDLVDKSIDYGVQYIDIDLKDTIHYKHVLKRLKKSNTKLILSHHNFDLTPNDEEIDKIIIRMSKFKPDIYKLCFKADTMNDIIRTMKIYQNYPQLSIVAFNLGDLGTLSRVLALQVGATFMYASRDSVSKTEDSQMSVFEINTIMQLLEL